VPGVFINREASMDPLKAKSLYEKYGFLIYGRCLRILCSEEDAKDAMQDIFLKLYNNREKFRNNEHIIPWIYKVSKNHCFNIIRQRRKFVLAIEPDTIADEHALEHSISNRNLIRKIFGVHNKKIQDAVYYTYVEELNQNEIQRITAQSPATIRRNLNRFKNSMKNIKKRLGI